MTPCEWLSGSVGLRLASDLVRSLNVASADKLSRCQECFTIRKTKDFRVLSAEVVSAIEDLFRLLHCTSVAIVALI